MLFEIQVQFMAAIFVFGKNVLVHILLNIVTILTPLLYHYMIKNLQKVMGKKQLL